MWTTGNGTASWFEGSREVLYDAGERARGYGTLVTDQIKAHPLAAAGIAFTVGYVLARFARRHADAR